MIESEGYYEPLNMRKIEMAQKLDAIGVETFESLLDAIKKPTLFELIKLLLVQSDRVIHLTYLFIRIIGSAMFSDWKTTVIGIIGLVAYIVKTIFNIDIPAEVQTGFITVLLFLIA